MVIISSAICNKAGKILVARQYTNISRLTLEEYVRNFPKSISASQQHTFVENEYIRYIYLPLETTMYLVLITNKNSNIIEDLETIRLVHKVIMDICTFGVSESTIQKNAFDILLAFDDVISFGFRESVTLNQVQNSLTMDSSDEKLHLMLLKARMNEAKEAAKKAQLEMKKKSKDPGYKGGQGGFSSDTADSSVKKNFGEPEVVVNTEPKYTAPQKETKGGASAPKKGLQIVKKKDTKAVPAEISKGNEEEIKQMMKEQETTEKKKTEYNPLQAPVSIECEEKIVCVLEKDGALNSFEVKGELFLLIRDSTKGNCAVYLQPETNNKAITLKPNPYFNRQKWTDKFALAPKDLKDSFNAGSKINCLKYRFASTNIDDVPFRFNYWFNEGSITCELEYNSDQSRIEFLDNVVISFEFPASETPEIKNVENGDYEVRDSTFRWITSRLDSSSTTSNIEIAFSSRTTPEDIFPFNVDFKLDYNFYKLGVKGAALLADETAIACDFTPTLSVERFDIE